MFKLLTVASFLALLGGGAYVFFVFSPSEMEVLVTDYQAISLMIAFGILIVAIMSNKK